MSNSGKWYLIQSKYSAELVKDIVREGIEGDLIQMDDRSAVPVDVVEGWNYQVTACRLVDVAKGEGILWPDSRLEEQLHYAGVRGRKGNQYVETLTLLQTIRDEYEMERKNKIFIPIEYRSLMLLTFQKARKFLAELIEKVTQISPQVDITDMKEEIASWYVELAEYDAILEQINGSQTSR